MSFDERSKELILEELKGFKCEIHNLNEFKNISQLIESYSVSTDINRQWELIFEAIPTMIAVIDKNHRILKVNKAMAQRLNIKPDDLVGEHCYPIIHNTDHPVDLCPHSMLLKDMKPHVSELRIDNLNGHFMVSVSPILDGNVFIGSLHVIHDITQSKELETIKNRLAAIVEYSEDAIIGKDLNGIITSWNQAAVKMYGYSPEEIIGKSISILLPTGKAEDFSFIIDKIRNGEYIKHYETVRKCKDGKKIFVSLTVSPIKEKDKIVGASTIARDITTQKKLELELMASEEKYRELFNNANDMISLNLIKEDGFPGKFIDINKIGLKRLGYTRDEFLNLTPQNIIAPDLYDEIGKNAKTLAKNAKAKYEIVHLTKNGKRIPVEVNNHIYEQNGKKVAIAISRDISVRKKTENALKDSEKKYRKIFENVQDIFYQTDMNGMITEISPSIERYSGYNPEELIGQSAEIFYQNPKEREKILQILFKKGEVNDYEIKLKTKTGRLVFVSLNAHYLLDSDNRPLGVEGSLRDISERKIVEFELKKSLEEKEMLLKEIHHRVKNNLMVISSLLNLQSRYIKDKEDLDLFRQSQNRANSMALIHERLYRSNDLKRIDFGDYIRTLADELHHTYVSGPDRIKLHIDVEKTMLDINTSIPLGLILNELISNAMKHAFPNNMNGTINVTFRSVDDIFELCVKDDGVGLPKDLDITNTDTLGLQLITSLTDQIDGDIEVHQNRGTEFKIVFKELEYKE